MSATLFTGPESLRVPGEPRGFSTVVATRFVRLSPAQAIRRYVAALGRRVA